MQNGQTDSIQCLAPLKAEKEGRLYQAKMPVPPFFRINLGSLKMGWHPGRCSRKFSQQKVTASPFLPEYLKVRVTEPNHISSQGGRTCWVNCGELELAEYAFLRIMKWCLRQLNTEGKMPMFPFFSGLKPHKNNHVGLGGVVQVRILSAS